MKENLEIVDIAPDAARQYIDANAAFTELERSRKKALQVRGGMVWKTVNGADYLIRSFALSVPMLFTLTKWQPVLISRLK